MQPLSFSHRMIVACREGNVDFVLSRREFVEDPRLGYAVMDGPVIEPVLNVSFVKFWLIVGLRRIHEPHSVGLYLDDRPVLLRIPLFVDQRGNQQWSSPALSGKCRAIWKSGSRRTGRGQFFPLAISLWKNK